MKAAISILTIAILASGIRAQDLPPPAPTGFVWRAVAALTDEFEGDRLDAGKWLPYQPYWKGREPSQFAPENVAVEGGLLKLRSTAMVTNLAVVARPEKDVWVRAACVSSVKPQAFHGYYAARMKASRLSMTSSFWFQGKYSEIDVVEQVGASRTSPGKDRLMKMNTHFFANGWDNDKATPVDWRMPAGAADTFHVYGVWWKDARTLWFYHDGVKVAELAPAGAFAEPMHLFFDTEVFIWEGLPTLESLADPARNTLSVDWVRAWQLVPADTSP